MEADSRKRCRRLLTVSVTALLVFLVWIHGEVVTVQLTEASKKYLMNENVFQEKVNNQEIRSRRKNATANAMAVAVRGSNHGSTTMDATKEESVTDTNSTYETALRQDVSLHNTSTRNATIVVFLSGEMGNHLSILAKALCVQLMAENEHNITAKLVFRHQSHPKWTRAREDLERCFPNLRGFNFSAANSVAFDDFSIAQDQLLTHGGWDPAKLKLISDFDNKVSIQNSLAYWKNMLDSPSIPTTNETSDTLEVTFPFLSVAVWCPLDILDQHLDEIRDFFEFEKSFCCRLQPDIDESVFHLRNFLLEMPRKGKKMGFEELSPNKTAWELFRHLNQNDKIAITSRFGGIDVGSYVLALKERGLQVRVIENQTGTQDFCFLWSAKKELVGTRLSTFVDWAAFLGQAKRVNLYRVMSPDTHATTFPIFNWTHPKLRNRVYSNVYKSEEQDALEENQQQPRRVLL